MSLIASLSIIFKKKIIKKECHYLPCESDNINKIHKL